MDITPTADDKGLQRLRLDQQNKTIKPARAVDAYPRIPDSEHQPPSPPPPHDKRHKGERRQGGERRLSPGDPDFDTRSHEERRLHQRRHEDNRDDEATKTTTQPHIDEIV